MVFYHEEYEALEEWIAAHVFGLLILQTLHALHGVLLFFVVTRILPTAFGQIKGTCDGLQVYGNEHLKELILPVIDLVIHLELL